MQPQRHKQQLAKGYYQQVQAHQAASSLVASGATPSGAAAAAGRNCRHRSGSFTCSRRQPQQQPLQAQLIMEPRRSRSSSLRSNSSWSLTCSCSSRSSRQAAGGATSAAAGGSRIFSCDLQEEPEAAASAAASSVGASGASGAGTPRSSWRRQQQELELHLVEQQPEQPGRSSKCSWSFTRSRSLEQLAGRSKCSS